MRGCSIEEYWCHWDREGKNVAFPHRAGCAHSAVPCVRGRLFDSAFGAFPRGKTVDVPFPSSWRRPLGRRVQVFDPPPFRGVFRGSGERPSSIVCPCTLAVVFSLCFDSPFRAPVSPRNVEACFFFPFPIIRPPTPPFPSFQGFF